MAVTTESVKRFHRDNPNQLLAIGVAAIVLVASLIVGILARRATAELAQKRGGWEEASNQIATVQQQFRVPTATESAALIAESGRMGALGVPEAEKVNLLDSIGRLAEACSLTQVRVRAASPPDSIFVAARAIGTQTINPAGYAVIVEFSGGFAGLVQFVSNLPPSVSITRLGAARHGSATMYQLVLSVYELNVNTAG